MKTKLLNLLRSVDVAHSATAGSYWPQSSCFIKQEPAMPTQEFNSNGRIDALRVQRTCMVM